MKLTLGRLELDLSRKVGVMGILNVTPDSFSDGGDFLEPEKAVDHALRMQQEGADILDLGAESTRPGAQEISANEEIRRLLPVLQRVVSKCSIPVSIDTRKAAVAAVALKEGASMINDISALTHDFRMAEVVAQAGVPIILMHMRGEPKTMQKDVRYINVVAEVIHFLRSRIQVAVQMGISRDRILVDPGLGFGKDHDHNLALLRGLSEFVKLEAPIVVGASRKRFVRRIVERDDPRDPDVITGSLAIGAIAAWNGASILRVHDVGMTVKAIRVVEALKS